MLSVDLNCDMGEQSQLFQYSIDTDLSLLPYLSSINLACGFHAGDAHTMHQLVEAALEQEVAVGAHPSFPDKENFGRTNIPMSPEMIYDIVLYQIGALHAFVKVYGSRLHHVKPHGALYNMAAADRLVANAVCNAVRDFDAGLILYGLSGSELIAAAQHIGLKTASEVFADRTYREDGSLTPRSQPGALIEDETTALQHVLQMVQEGTVRTINQQVVPVTAETICIHGDGSHALLFARSVHALLKQHHVSIQQP